jgi:hypothetical protein
MKWSGLVVLCAALLAAALVMSGRSGETQIATGQVYSTDRGDPIDVFAGPGDRPGSICANTGAFFYGSGVNCFEVDDARATGSWSLEIPTTRRKPPIVVGVMPSNAGGATVRIGETEVRASSRGRWFLATLRPGALGLNNATPVSVDFD